jgi:hypothetical protein
MERSFSMIAGTFTLAAVIGLLDLSGCGTKEKETLPNPHAVELMIQQKIRDKLPPVPLTRDQGRGKHRSRLKGQGPRLPRKSTKIGASIKADLGECPLAIRSYAPFSEPGGRTHEQDTVQA